MKWGVGPELLFHEGGKVERSDATPIKYFTSYGNIFVINRKKIDGSGTTPSYFTALILVLPLILLHRLNYHNTITE